MGRTRYARSAEEARAFREAVHALLDCPMCGCNECVTVNRSASAVVIRCTECRLRFHLRRCDLADAVRHRAEASTGDERVTYWQLAELVDVLDDRAPVRQWSDPTLA
jgi:transcription elongation factor Elf1